MELRRIGVQLDPDRHRELVLEISRRGIPETRAAETIVRRISDRLNSGLKHRVHVWNPYVSEDVQRSYEDALYHNRPYGLIVAEQEVRRFLEELRGRGTP